VSNDALRVAVFEPFFEECNRTRRLLSEMSRALTSHGIVLQFVELPGTGESLIEIADVRLADWRRASSDVIDTIKPIVIASLRGGALLDGAGDAQGWWRFAPETGSRIVRDLRRTQLAGEGTKLYAGNALSDDFLTDLESATPAPLTHLRTLRLESDAADADHKIAGSPLWRRAEPGEDTELAASLAIDLAEWTRTCAAR
jgi:hypothetical protein